MKRPPSIWWSLHVMLTSHIRDGICLPVVNKDNTRTCNYRSDNGIGVRVCLIC